MNVYKKKVQKEYFSSLINMHKQNIFCGTLFSLIIFFDFDLYYIRITLMFFNIISKNRISIYLFLIDCVTVIKIIFKMVLLDFYFIII